MNAPKNRQSPAADVSTDMISGVVVPSLVACGVSFLALLVVPEGKWSRFVDLLRVFHDYFATLIDWPAVTAGLTVMLVRRFSDEIAAAIRGRADRADG